MYTAFNPNRFGKSILWLFAGIIVLLTTSVYEANSIWELLRMVGFATGVFVLAIYGFLGTSSYWSPWRGLWRQFPVLNVWLYPDINGVWYGTTQSNWPVMSRVREAAGKGKRIDLSKLTKVELESGEIAMNIRASFLGISIRSHVGATNGESFSIAARADRYETGPDFTLSYVYRQATPQPQPTDEGSHTGAATLEVKPGEVPVMDGQYWTRRKWREGMNTAGLIRVDRVNVAHAPRTEDLLAFARASASSAKLLRKR